MIISSKARTKGDIVSIKLSNGEELIASWCEARNDVLIIDRSLTAKPNNLALTIEEGEFKIQRIPKEIPDEEFLIWGVITYVIHAVL